MVPADAARDADASLQTILKAVVLGARTQDAASRPAGEDAGAFASTGAIEPPYDPEALCLLVENSNSLRPNLDAYATNIDAFGHRFEPTIDLDADDAEEHVSSAIEIERQAAQRSGSLPEGTPLTPSPEDVTARLAKLRRLARAEHAKLASFFASCCFDHSFVELRRRTRHDVESTGNAYWEVLRDGTGQIARLVYVPSPTMRLLPPDRGLVEVDERVRVSPIAFDTVRVRRRFRRFVQIQQGERPVYFKSLGDPRSISSANGRVLTDTDASTETPATEILHFTIHSTRSPYGVPRWIGALLPVLGSRQMEEVNYLYFTNKSVPPLALLVSGGRLSESSVPRIERYIEEHLRGTKNFHKILILEAETSGSSEGSHAKIELRPLTDAQQEDALFQQYDQRNIDKVGSAFRLPRILRGESNDFNRSTSESALRFAEDQVFQPQRDEFDSQMDMRVLTDMGVRFWRFRSQTPVARDPARLTDMVERLTRVGVLTPEEGRMLAEDIFNRPFKHIGDDWTKRPINLTLAGIQTGVQDLRPDVAPVDSLVNDAKRLLTLREDLRAEEDRLAQGRMDLARRYLDTETVRVPRAEFDAWFGGADAAT